MGPKTTDIISFFTQQKTMEFQQYYLNLLLNYMKINVVTTK